MKDICRIIGIGLILLMGAGCVPGHLIYISDPYRGRVIDTETKAPLEGAVVLATWYRETIVLMDPESPAVGYHDALEVLTDAKGEFTVPWKIYFTLFGKIRKPAFFIYYPGYAHYPSVHANLGGEKVHDAYESHFFPVELLKWNTDQEKEDRFTVASLGDPEVPLEKKKNLTRLINVERVTSRIVF